MTHGYRPGGADPAMNRVRADRKREREKGSANAPTGTQNSQIIIKLDALTKRISQLVEFLTGQQGYASSDSSWSDGSNPSGNLATVTFADYDAKYDCSTTFTAQSSVVDVRIAAWLDAKTNAYAPDGKTAYGVNATAALGFDLLDADTGAVVHQPSADDAAQTHTEVWGTNIANVVGATGSNIARVTGLITGHKYTLRSRHGRSGYAHDEDGSHLIAMPDGGWWSVVVNSPRLNVTMVAATDKPPDPTTPTDPEPGGDADATAPDATTDGGSS